MIPKKWLAPSLLILILNTFLLACQASDNPIALTSTASLISTETSISISVTPANTTMGYEEDETPLTTPEPILTHSPSPVATPVSLTPGTPTIEPTIGIEATIQPARICSTAPTRFSTSAATGIIGRMFQISFLDDQTIAFSGWAQRALPTPEVIPTPVTPITVSNSGIPNAWVELKQAQLNLTNAEITRPTPDFAPLLRDPCHGECLLDIISQSPDGQWQLIQVSAGVYNDLGFWLVGQDETVQLVNFVPSFSTWQWASDSSILWFVHSLYEYGLRAVLAQLDTAPIVLLADELGENPLFYATRYVSAFNPMAKTLLLTVSEEAPSDTDELLTFDLTESYTQTSSTRIVAGIKSVVWNEATQEYLLIVVQEDGLAITDLEGQILVYIPVETFEMIFPTLSDSDLTFDLFIPNSGYALSASGQYLAIGYDSFTGIYVFECQETS